MKVLAIDTSNDVLGIALVNNTKVIGEYITNLKKNHSIRVMPAIERLLHDCEWNPSDLEKIVVAKGPGSYTGVRIGVTIAKTLAWSLNIPIVGVSSLAVMASAAHFFNGFISPFIDARRGQIYTGLYHYKEGQLQVVVEDVNILAKDWLEKLKQKDEKILFIGNDTRLHEETIHTIMGDQAFIAPVSLYNPRPSELGLLGLPLLGEDVHTFVPNYIRLVEAEAKWLEKQNEGNHQS